MPQHVMNVGKLEIVAMLDSWASVPCAAVFPTVGHAEWAPYSAHLDGPDKFPLPVGAFLVRGAGETVLIDTGIGAKDRPTFPNGRLPDLLAEAGVQPDDVDFVLATHIHIDHVGWHTTVRGEAYVPTFPKAKHVFARAEWDYWTAPDVALASGNEHVVDCVLPLEGVADISLVAGEHKLTDELTLLPTPGHTPAHTSVAIMSAGEAGVIIGDVCHHPAQVTEGWSPVFDMNPALAMESREKLLQRIEADRMTVIAGHFPHPGFGRVVRTGGKRYWRAL